MITKLEHIKFANQVSINSKGEMFVKSKDYDIELEGMIVRVWPKGKKKMGPPDETSLMNAIYWKRMPEDTLTGAEPTKELDVTSTASVRSGKKGAKPAVA